MLIILNLQWWEKNVDDWCIFVCCSINWMVEWECDFFVWLGYVIFVFQFGGIRYIIDFVLYFMLMVFCLVFLLYLVMELWNIDYILIFYDYWDYCDKKIICQLLQVNLKV